MNIGIVGLPNVGKSTLFKALTKKQVDIANYPFCTIDPNVGIVKVPDERLAKLTELMHSAKTVPTSIEFVDIAGLVKGASQGEGLGNKFLSHIREVDAIAQVVRLFKDNNIIHVAGEPKPLDDIDVINLELMYADMATLEKRIGALKAQMKSGKTRIAEETLAIAENIYTSLESGKPANTLSLSDEEKELVRDLHLLTLKPFLYVLNVDEEMGSGSVSGSESVPDPISSEVEQKLAGYPIVKLCAQQEADMAELSDEEVHELGMKRTGLDIFISAAYTLLDLITFFTTGPDETRAWTIAQGTKAPQAAGVIHTDFEKGFIRAETINWKELIDAGGEAAAKEKGLIRSEGKEYVVKDGDVVVFRFNV